MFLPSANNPSIACIFFALSPYKFLKTSIFFETASHFARKPLSRANHMLFFWSFTIKRMVFFSNSGIYRFLNLPEDGSRTESIAYWQPVHICPALSSPKHHALLKGSPKEKGSFFLWE